LKDFKKYSREVYSLVLGKSRRRNPKNTYGYGYKCTCQKVQGWFSIKHLILNCYVMSEVIGTERHVERRTMVSSVPDLRLNVNSRALGVIAMALFLAATGCKKCEGPDMSETRHRFARCFSEKIPALPSRVCIPEEIPKLLDEAAAQCPEIGPLDAVICSGRQRPPTVAEVGTDILNDECREVMRTKPKDGGTLIVPVIIP